MDSEWDKKTSITHLPDPPPQTVTGFLRITASWSPPNTQEMSLSQSLQAAVTHLSYSEPLNKKLGKWFYSVLSM